MGQGGGSRPWRPCLLSSLLALVLVGCVHPSPEGADSMETVSPAPSRIALPFPSEAEVEVRRARTRAQFEAASRGERHSPGKPHRLVNCPHCVDPMKGLVPDESLIDGPMPVWN